MKLPVIVLLFTLRGCGGSPHQGSPHSGSETRQRNKNRCAYVVHRNVSCAVVAAAETSQQPGFEHSTMYRTHFRPIYKIAYKTVTELEWRCCPGYQGRHCREVKNLRLLQVERSARPHSTADTHGSEVDPDGHPWVGQEQSGGRVGQRLLEGYGGSQRERHLEEEVQRLSQMVLDMQGRMTDMTSNLRLDLQEDTSKMLVTLLNNLRQPVSARGAETHALQLQGLSSEYETTAAEEVLNKIGQVSDDLESKSKTLDELLGRVNRHDGQIHLLMEAARTAVATPPPAPLAGEADLRALLDEKIRDLRAELIQGVEIKLSDLKSSCDYKIMSVQEQCEGQEASYLSLAELMDSKETDLRNEIQHLKAGLESLGDDARPAASGASDPILVRMNHLESRVNSSEESVAARFSSVEENLKRDQAEVIGNLREDLEAELTSAVARLTNLLSDASRPPPSGVQTETLVPLQREVKTLRGDFQTLENKSTVLDQLCSQECQTAVDAMERQLLGRFKNDSEGMQRKLLHHSSSMETIRNELSSLRGHLVRLDDALADVVLQQSQAARGPDARQVDPVAERGTTLRLEPSAEARAEAGGWREDVEEVKKMMSRMDSRIVSVESVCEKLDPISGSLQRIKEGLNKHVSSLWTCVNQLNGTVKAQARNVGQLKATLQKLQDRLPDAAGDIQVPPESSAGKTGVEVQTEVTRRHQEPRGSLTAPVLEKGEAGPPGRMSSSGLPRGMGGSLTPVQGFAGAPASSSKPSKPPAPQLYSAQTVTFSAGLTLPPFHGDVGVVRFNKVLVNDGGHYDPDTGFFTAPTDGHYLLMAVLAAERGRKVEAILSVSNRTVQRLDSAGFPPAAASSRDGCDCGGSLSLSLVLPLRHGDRVGVLVTAGKLAVPAASEIASTFSVVLLQPGSRKR